MIAMRQRRSSKLARLMKVQNQIERLADIELAEVRRHEAGLRRERLEIMTAMAQDSLPHRLFSDHYAERITTLSGKEQRLEKIALTLGQKAVGEHAKTRKLKERHRGLFVDEQRQSEDEALQDFISERTAARLSAQKWRG